MTPRKDPDTLIKRKPLPGEARVCIRCDVLQPDENFYRHPHGARGRCTICNTCKRGIDAARGSREGVSTLEQLRARRATMRAIRAGELVRQPCEVCGRKAQAHHPDYSKPLYVKWLCPLHHRQVHAKALQAAKREVVE